ncbi:hypothetical protein KIPB_002505 [Kipferlia bialata]|uniref:Uncharacterized protein n=1 Tax=Kipferlia bialata TaxID=797122 RepID=A0A9K3CSC8_9EUKA|nr:hypothetical protein KIPB_002505 [Kipferlia bialata]|eukprot:g2505.t1
MCLTPQNLEEMRKDREKERNMRESLQKDGMRLQTTIQAQEMRISVLERDIVDQANVHKATLQELDQGHAQDIEELQEQHKQDMEEATGAAEAEKAERDQRIQTLESEYASLETVVDDMNAKIANQEDTQARLEDRVELLEGDLDTARASISQKEREVAQLEDRLEAAGDVQSKLEAKDEEISSLKQAIQQTTDEVQRYVTANQQLQSQLESLSQEMGGAAKEALQTAMQAQAPAAASAGGVPPLPSGTPAVSAPSASGVSGGLSLGSEASAAVSAGRAAFGRSASSPSIGMGRHMASVPPMSRDNPPSTGALDTDDSMAIPPRGQAPTRDLGSVEDEWGGTGEGERVPVDTPQGRAASAPGQGGATSSSNATAEAIAAHRERYHTVPYPQDRGGRNDVFDRILRQADVLRQRAEAKVDMLRQERTHNTERVLRSVSLLSEAAGFGPVPVPRDRGIVLADAATGRVEPPILTATEYILETVAPPRRRFAAQPPAYNTVRGSRAEPAEGAVMMEEVERETVRPNTAKRERDEEPEMDQFSLPALGRIPAIPGSRLLQSARLDREKLAPPSSPMAGPGPSDPMTSTMPMSARTTRGSETAWGESPRRTRAPLSARGQGQRHTHRSGVGSLTAASLADSVGQQFTPRPPVSRPSTASYPYSPHRIPSSAQRGRVRPVSGRSKSSGRIGPREDMIRMLVGDRMRETPTGVKRNKYVMSADLSSPRMDRWR